MVWCRVAVLLAFVAAVAALSIALFAFSFWAAQWGSTADERTMAMPGDEYLVDRIGHSVVMTRAVTIHAPVEDVWPWIAQLGRGAGWYSYDFLDNGRKMSARHIVSWIPEPRLGDASPVGYIAHLVEGRELTWWADGVRFGGSNTRLVWDNKLSREGEMTRFIVRVSADASGGFPWLVIMAFRFLDGIMALKMMRGVKERTELYGTRALNERSPETGARDQYQHYEVIYASGDRAGTPGVEGAETWRAAAVNAGLVPRAD